MRCNLCELSKTCTSVKIDGRGSETPTYLFVGEAPGEEEDLRGLPFVGPSGSLLTQAIKEFDLKPARVTNSVRCRPLNNKPPSPKEIETCKPFLFEEIIEKKPKMIVACGNVALRALTGKNGILKYAGRVVGDVGGTPVFAVYHPAYVLRYPYKGHTWERHFKELKKLTEGRLDKQVDTQIVDNKKALELLKTSEEHFVTLDLETNGEYKQTGGQIRCIGFHTQDQTFVTELDGRPEHFLASVADLSIKKCAHNSIFEMRWFLDECHRVPANFTYDTMLLHYLLDENLPHDLESVAMEMMEVSPWKIELEMAERGWTWATVPIDTLAHYCGRDVYYTHHVMKKMIKIFKERPDLQPVYQYYKRVLLPLAELCAKFEQRGFHIDGAWAAKVDAKYQEENDKLYSKIAGMHWVAQYIEERKAKDAEFKLNLGSQRHVRDIVCTKLKLKPKGVTDGGQVSVDYDSLEPFRKKSAFVRSYMEWKDRETLRNSYTKKFPKFADKQGIIRPDHNPAFQVTNRISVKNPPLSNMPREKDVRGIVCSRFEGGSILGLDYRQLEMRLLASEAMERKMLDIFAAGGDVHNDTALKMFGPGFTPEQRSLCKNINFGTVYGIEEWSFSKKFYVTVEDAKEWLGRHREIYTEIYKWMDDQHTFIQKNGYVASRFGLLRRLPEAKRAQDKELKAIFRQAGNFPIQSQGASITNLAGIALNAALEKFWEFQSVFYHIHHDSLVIDCSPGEEGKIEELGRKIMEMDIPSQCAWLKVGLPVDVKKSYRWGE